MNADLFKLILRNSYLAVAGGMALLPPVGKEVVERGWLTEEEFAGIVSMSMAMPGVFSFNFCSCLGRKIGGLKGCLSALAGLAVPALVSVLAMILLFGKLAGNEGFESFLKGIRPAVVALLVWPCVMLGRNAKINFSNIVLPLGAALLIWLLRISPFYIVLVVAIGGYVYGRFVKSD